MAGRKTSYKKSYVNQAREACAMGGFSNAELGRLFGVSKSTVWKWRQTHLDFDAACREGFESFAVNEAQGSLTKLVRGYSFTEVTREAVKISKDPLQTEMRETKRVRKHVQPNINALKIILERYDRDKELQSGGELSDLVAEIDGTTRTLAPEQCELLSDDS